MSQDLPKGFYKSEDGVQRYWDGQQWLEPSSEPSSASTSKKGFVKLVAILGAVAAVIVGGVFLVSEISRVAAEDEQKRIELETQARFEERASEIRGFFQDVVETCSVGSGVVFDETLMSIDGRGEDDSSGVGYLDVLCLIEGAGMPEAVQSRFGTTNALQGRVEGDWKILDGDAEVFASWSYHPDSGPNVSLELESVFLESFDYEKHKDLVDSTEPSETPSA